MQAAYDSYAHLNEYNAAAEVEKALSSLSKTIAAASSLVLPDPTGTVTSVGQGLFKDIIDELAKVRENRDIRSGSEQLARVLDKQFRTIDDNLDDLCKRTENYTQTTQIIAAWKQANLNYLQARNKIFSTNMAKIGNLATDFAQAQAEIKVAFQQLQQGVATIGQVSSLLNFAYGFGFALLPLMFLATVTCYKYPSFIATSQYIGTLSALFYYAYPFPYLCSFKKAWPV